MRFRNMIFPGAISAIAIALCGCGNRDDCRLVCPVESEEQLPSPNEPIQFAYVFDLQTGAVAFEVGLDPISEDALISDPSHAPTLADPATGFVYGAHTDARAIEIRVTDLATSEITVIGQLEGAFDGARWRLALEPIRNRLFLLPIPAASLAPTLAPTAAH
jgi:hypothetical protein